MTNEIISIKQLPIIEERLSEINSEITIKVNEALNLSCTEETVKEIKKVRAELNKQFKEFEEKRKGVKKAITEPYNRFEKIYKTNVGDVFAAADTNLKMKIDEVENNLKNQKIEEVKAYFEEYRIASGIDFITYEQANINVTLSASLKSLKEQAKNFVDKIFDDLILISSQEYVNEIMYEYKKTLNASASITNVIERHKAIEREKAKQSDQTETSSIMQNDNVLANEPVAPPLESPIEETPILTVNFTVKGTMAQLKELKKFLNEGDYDYE